MTLSLGLFCVRFKEGCETHPLAPSGVRILGALERCARQMLLRDLIVTCGSDSHGPDDPHSKGEAFDVRSHDLTPKQKEQLLLAVMQELSDGQDSDPLVPKDGGYVTRHFFGWLEHPNEPTEHFHFQQRNKVAYP